MNSTSLPRAGHCGGHLRNPFDERVDEVAANRGSLYEDAELRRLAGKLWSCTDVMPGEVCADLELPRGSSYAQAARVLRRAASA